jgi:hypothetical protein
MCGADVEQSRLAHQQRPGIPAHSCTIEGRYHPAASYPCQLQLLDVALCPQRCSRRLCNNSSSQSKSCSITGPMNLLSVIYPVDQRSGI